MLYNDDIYQKTIALRGNPAVDTHDIFRRYEVLWTQHIVVNGRYGNKQNFCVG